MRARALAAAGVAALAIGVAGCGSSSSGSAPPSAAATSAPTTVTTPPGAATTAPAVNPNAPEVSPSGDIPDNQAYVRYAPPGAGYSVKVPEGWARTTAGGAVTFTDKLNAIRLESRPATSAPSVASVRAGDLATLARTVPGYRPGDVTTVTRSAGTAVRITYLADSPKDAVTGKSHTDAVERYIFFHNGRAAVLTLSGPQGADNVDPWMIVTDSVTWTR
jgi:hypothetical protein